MFLLNHALGFRPAGIDRFLMAGGIGADGGNLFLGSGEMQTAVAREIVIGDMRRIMRHAVGGADVDASVRENHPDRPGVPGVPTEDLQHFRGIIGG